MPEVPAGPLSGVASLHSPFTLGLATRREEGLEGRGAGYTWSSKQESVSRGLQDPLLTSHWPVLGHMATCPPEAGKAFLFFFLGGKSEPENGIGS